MEFFMKKIIALAIIAFLFIACSNDGYTFSTTYSYDENSGILNRGTVSCNYNSESKTFTWGENNKPWNSNKIKIVGDSMWISPAQRKISDDSSRQQFYDEIYNLDTLALSNDHNGLYGTWNMTKCTRIYGKTEVNCDSSNEFAIYNRTLKFTQDSLYVTKTFEKGTLAKDDSIGNKETEQKRSTLYSFILLNTLGLMYEPYMSSVLVKLGVFKFSKMDYYHQVFSIANQSFEYTKSIWFDSTGENLLEVFSSNGKTCSRQNKSAFITKNLCLEKDEDFLLSARDKYIGPKHYDDGPVFIYDIDNQNDFDTCVRSLPTKETLDSLSKYPYIDYGD